MDTAELLEVAENLERENQVQNLVTELEVNNNQKLRAEKENIIEEHRQERNELMEQITSLQEENSKYLDTIVRHSKGNADQNLAKFGTFNSQE